MIAIGDELLSGRTKDKNIAHLAQFLTVKGIELAEVRIIADDTDAIIAAVNTLRAKHQYLFTSGGIGPTHDDITSDAIALAFGVSIDHHPEAIARLEAHYQRQNMPFTPARQKMARIPQGAILIDNPVSVAPGFKMENVFVMAGVPSVFNAMVQSLEPQLVGGEILHAITLDCALGEGTIGDTLAQIAINHPETSIGSYPRFQDDKYSTQIVIRCRSTNAAEKAADDVKAMIAALSNT